MRRLLLTAMGSGQGKTVVTCAMLAALKRRGRAVRAFKCGPDYIDPMFHSRVLGVPSRNLDLFLQGEEGVRRSLRLTAGDTAVLEGAMGYYDGLNGTAEASAYDIARRTGTPAVLIVRPQGASLSLAAQIRGMRDFRADSGLRALLLNDCAPERAARLRPLLERETGLPVLGCLPHSSLAALESRHLGLKTAAEIAGLGARFEELAALLEKNADLDALLALAAEGETDEGRQAAPAPNCRVAVARDEAFCFCYADTLEALERAGAELCFFSPLRDAALPEADGLYLPGGYPELYAERLAANAAMLAAVAAAVRDGMPTVAECGGFLYLQRELEDAQGRRFPLCGVLPGRGFRTGGLQHFGYATLEAETDSMLFRAGERVPAHEFHYWDCTENGDALLSRKADGRAWAFGFAGRRLYAGFPHLCFAGEIPLAERFVKACREYGEKTA